jgi:hypothetical protein
MRLSFFINMKGDRWDILKSYSKFITKNCAFEFNWYDTHSWIMVDLIIKRYGDHKGLYLMFGIFGKAIDINVYDLRKEKIPYE